MYLIVSNRPAFVSALTSLLNPYTNDSITIEARATLDEALALAETSRPTLAVIDGQPLDLSALHAGTPLANIAKRTRALLVDANFSPDMELAALALGIVGCCKSRLTESELRKIINVALKGEIWISRAALPDLIAHLRRVAHPAPKVDAGAKLDLLTPREKEIALCVAEGAANKIIAKRLSVSDATIKAHLTAIFQKLGVSGRVQLALLLSGDRHPPSSRHEKVA